MTANRKAFGQIFCTGFNTASGDDCPFCGAETRWDGGRGTHVCPNEDKVVSSVVGPFADPQHPELGDYIRIHFYGNLTHDWIAVHAKGDDNDRILYRRWIEFAE